MKKYCCILVLLSVLGNATLAKEAANPLTSGLWELPACAKVAGTGAITFTKDDGATLAPTLVGLHGIGYTFGLAPMSLPNHLVAQHNGTILRSDDSGCTWTVAEESSQTLLTFAAGPGGRVFAWGDNTRQLMRITPNHVAKLPLAPVRAVVGLGVDSLLVDHLRIGGDNGTIWDSADGGKTWRRVGTLPGGGSNSLRLIYRFAFDPNNLNHILIGLARQGAYVTTDGGKTWIRSRGLSSSRGPVNVFNVVVSPADPSIVWAMGLDLNEHDRGLPSEGRHIYRSKNGGDSFQPVVDHSADVTLINGPLMAAHPTDSNVLYFVFGTFFSNYGTDLFKYDYQSQRLSKAHNRYHGISSIAFSPADPALLYLGLTVEEGIF